MTVHERLRYHSGLDDSPHTHFENALEKQIQENDIDAKDEHGYTLLHYAAMKSSIAPSVMEIILKYSPTLYVLSNEEKKTAMDLAFGKGNCEKVLLLVRAGFDINRVNEYGETYASTFRKLYESDPAFYGEAYSELGLPTRSGVKTHEPLKTPATEVDVMSLVEHDNYDLAAIRLRVKMEKLLREEIINVIGANLSFLTNSFSLHDMIYHAAKLNIITDEQRDFMLDVKQVLNYYCHDNMNEKKIDFYLNLDKDNRKAFFKNAYALLDSL